MIETKNVFIDTQCFINANLQFDNSALKTFRQYCHNNELNHIMTSVVEREVEDNIRKSVEEALSSIKKFQRKARLLSKFEDDNIKSLFQKIAEEDIHSKALSVFSEFIDGCKSQYADAESVNTEEILDLYFKRKPPFGTGKKKSEFPDAISLISLKNYLNSEEKIYVISDDNDLKTFCQNDEQFIQIDSIDKFLDLYSTYKNNRSNQIKEYISDNSDIIEDEIKTYLEDTDVYNMSSWEEAEVDGKINVTYVGDLDPSIIFIDDEECQVTFEVESEFEVSVTGPDFNNGIYDKEDGVTYTFDSTTQTTTVNDTYSVELSFHYECDNGTLENIEHHDLYIPSVSGGIEVCVEENENDFF